MRSSLGHWFQTFVRHHHHPDVCLHRLRHTVATVLVADGQLLQAPQRLGHAEASTTLRQYCHALPLHDQDVADQLSNLLDNAYGSDASEPVSCPLRRSGTKHSLSKPMSGRPEAVVACSGHQAALTSECGRCCPTKFQRIITLFSPAPGCGATSGVLTGRLADRDNLHVAGVTSSRTTSPAGLLRSGS